jgi:hypothetical protein
MRVLIGLAALAASVNAQGTTVTLSGSTSSLASVPVDLGTTALATISVFQTSISGPPAVVTPSGFGIQLGTYVNSNNFAITVENPIDTLVFAFVTNKYTAQLQHRWFPNYPNPATLFPGNSLSAQSYTCDLCAGGNAISCQTSTGPGSAPSPTAGFNCALLARQYRFSGLVASPNPPAAATINSFAVQLFDRNTNPGPNVTSYSFTIVRKPNPIIGDPQIYGLQGQDFQVHGIPDEIFNMITYPNLQVNARFVYLSSGACHDNFTACFAHPGTYISEEGIRLGKDKVHIVAGSFKKGLTVSVNGKKMTESKSTLKLGSVHMINHRRVVVKTPIMAITISNSDKFLNQETSLYDAKLLALGAERKVLLDGEKFHPEVPLHGLQGQTWRNVEYPSGLEYEGSISDYHVTSGNLYGNEFVFNQFKH